MDGTTPTPRTLAAGPGAPELASVLDQRLTELWAELFAIPRERWDHDLIGWFMRAAYGQGYCDALSEPQTGELCRELGYQVPAASATRAA
jgi:hypothetical protein